MQSFVTHCRVSTGRVIVALALLAFGAASTTRAQSEALEGFDLFVTDETQTDLLGIPFQGVPSVPPLFDFPGVGPKAIADTDTIVQRLEAAVVASVPGTAAPIAIEVIHLNLRSQFPIDPDGAGGLPADFLYVTLQKDRPIHATDPLLPGPPSLGTMDVTFATAAGGTFDADFIVFADLRYGAFDGPIVCGAPLPPCIDFDAGFPLSTVAAVWGRIPPPASVKINDVNRHLAGPGDNSKDFWAGVPAGGGTTVCVAHNGHPDPGGAPTTHGTCATPCTTVPLGEDTGCDGLDSNCNGLVDDCAEDLWLPDPVCPANATLECFPGIDVSPAVTGSGTGNDDCNPSSPTVITDASHEDFITPRCGNTFDVDRIWEITDECGNTSFCLQQIFVVDTTVPSVFPPGDLTVECPAPLSGPSSEEGWVASVTGSDICSTATTSSAELLRVEGCGNTYQVTYEFWATDECDNESARPQRTYVVEDTTPPVFSLPGDQFNLSIWPPGHGYVVYSTDALVSASDTCGGTVVTATGCHSSQPEDVAQGGNRQNGAGDGNTFEDCVLSTDGKQFAVRRERLGACGRDSSRTYTVTFTATDECGNQSQAVGKVGIEHDRSEHKPLGLGIMLRTSEPPPFPYTHPTTYGTGCAG